MKRGAPASFFTVATHLGLLDHALEKVLRLSPEVRIVSLSHHQKLVEYVSIIVVHAAEYDCIISYQESHCLIWERGAVNSDSETSVKKQSYAVSL